MLIPHQQIVSSAPKEWVTWSPGALFPRFARNGGKREKQSGNVIADFSQLASWRGGMLPAPPPAHPQAKPDLEIQTKPSFNALFLNLWHQKQEGWSCGGRLSPFTHSLEVTFSFQVYATTTGCRSHTLANGTSQAACKICPGLSDFNNLSWKHTPFYIHPPPKKNTLPTVPGEPRQQFCRILFRSRMSEDSKAGEVTFLQIISGT